MSQESLYSLLTDISEKPMKVLFVDDEVNILSSLKRLFEETDYDIFTAANGIDGLQILEEEPIDLVVSDMRMPKMDGATFLSQVAKKFPESVRMLLTGYSDMTSTIEAINKGGIYHYISKPWEDHDILLTVSRALENKRLKEQQKQLNRLVQRQNKELKKLNADLDKKVLKRTAELKQTVDMLDAAYSELKSSYNAAISVFANLVELREKKAQGHEHSKRVAELAKKVAEKMQLEEDAVQNIYYAGLLHEIGKIGLPGYLLERPYSQLSLREKEQFKKYPALSEAALMALEPLHEAASLIRSHREHFDGTGYPDGLYGGKIPLGARILAITNDYDAVQCQANELSENPLTENKARDFLMQYMHTWYDPQILEVFFDLLDELQDALSAGKEAKFRYDRLREGMVLSRDLFDESGILLLTKGHKLSKSQINRLQEIGNYSSLELMVHVCK